MADAKKLSFSKSPILKKNLRKFFKNARRILIRKTKELRYHKNHEIKCNW